MLIRNVRLVDLRPPAELNGRPDAPQPIGRVVDVRLRAGRVSAIAPRLAPLAREQTFDGEGRWLLPGLWDSHVHLTQWARAQQRLDLAGTKSAAEAVARVAARLAELPADDAKPLLGYGHRSAVWPSQPAVAELDAVSGSRPVILVSGDAHNGWLNSAAQRLLGVPPTDRALAETEWFEVAGRLDQLPGQDDPVPALRSAMQAAAARGIVGVSDFEFGRDYVCWPDRIAAGLDLIRIRASVYPEWLPEVLEAGIRSGAEFAECRGLVTMGGLKVISDGSLNTRTAHCCQPYADAPPGADSRSRFGAANYSPVELTELLRLAVAGGLEAAVHAIGDAALASALDAFEQVRSAPGPRGARVAGSIEHAQLITPDAAMRMARLGLRASVQPAHLLDDRDVTERCWPDRTDRVYAFRTLLDAGVALTLGSDAPVSPLDPWLAVAAAVHRSADERPPWHPEQALTIREALAASTGSRQLVEVGSVADLVLLDNDPLGAAETTAEQAVRLRSMPVAATFVGGRQTFSAR